MIGPRLSSLDQQHRARIRLSFDLQISRSWTRCKTSRVQSLLQTIVFFSVTSDSSSVTEDDLSDFRFAGRAVIGCANLGGPDMETGMKDQSVCRQGPTSCRPVLYNPMSAPICNTHSSFPPSPFSAFTLGRLVPQSLPSFRQCPLAVHFSNSPSAFSKLK